MPSGSARPRRTDIARPTSDIDHMPSLVEQLERHLAQYFESACLAQRERQMFLHLLTGATNRRIAESIGLSEHTVETYLKDDHSHFGNRPRRAVVMIALEVLVARINQLEQRVGLSVKSGRDQPPQLTRPGGWRGGD